MIPPAPTSMTNCGVFGTRCIPGCGCRIIQDSRGYLGFVTAARHSLEVHIRGYEKHLIPDCEALLSPSTLVLFLEDLRENEVT